jgi:hypothetical protein
VVTAFVLVGLLLPLLLITAAIALEQFEERLDRTVPRPNPATAGSTGPNGDEESEMDEVAERRERRLRAQPGPGTGAETAEPQPNGSADAFAFTEAVARAGWSMRLHALIGEEVARAVGVDIITPAEAEVLLGRLALVIDQAVGANER